MKYAAIILCAGSGRRFKSLKDKVFVKLANQELFLYSYKIFESLKVFSQIIIVSKPNQFSLIRSKIRDKRLVLARGGKLRQDSVYNGLKVLNKDIDYVVIHDGARPFIDKAMLKKLLNLTPKEIGATFVKPIKEAVKEVKKSYIKKTIDRKNIYTVQTPQILKVKLILKAYKKYGRIFTYDDTQLLELLGKKVKALCGPQDNIKITYQEDLNLAKEILRAKKKL